MIGDVYERKKVMIEYTQEVEETVQAVSCKNGKYYCQRCLNVNQKSFYRDDLGVYCELCLMFGKSSENTMIQRTHISNKEMVPYTLTKMVYLSELQQIASKRCIQSYQKKRDILIFAVCGAGKTELVYDVILKALNERKYVCFATPRKDVVLELLPRFKRDFSQVTIIGLFGGSLDKGKIGNFTISTTHQLIHYYHFFDLIILDEVDAFPFYNNKMLESFVYKAKRKDASMIYLTATPTRKLKQQMASKKLDYFIIPSRFHKKPIPLPKVVMVSKVNQLLEKGVVPKKIRDWLELKRQNNKQVFIFVPNIIMGKKLEAILQKTINCRFVCSTSIERKETIQDFRNGRLQMIITTTILERGVTVSHVDACIVLACDEIFDERSIVQIVGRAGRDKKHPTADVRLFCEDYTNAIKDSIRHIRQMNRRNRQLHDKEGLL